MAAPTGIATQIGYARETGTVGVPVVPSYHIPLLGESLERKIDPSEDEAVIAGRRILDSTQWLLGDDTIAGDAQHYLYNIGLGAMLYVAMGSKSTSSLGGGLYAHTLTPGDLTGLALTAQKGVPGVGGTVYPFLYSGLKVASWEFGFEPGKYATAGFTFAGMREFAGSRVVTDGVLNSTTTVTSATAVFSSADVDMPISGTGIPVGATIASVTNATTIVLSAAATATATGRTLTIGPALATATLPTGIRPFHCRRATISLGGSTLKVTKGTVSGDNQLDTSRRFVGSDHVDEPLEQDLRTYDGSLEVEFRDLTLYKQFLNGTEAALVVTFTDGTNSLVITENVRLDGETPKVSGRGIVKQNLPFKAVGSTDAAAITMVLTNSESSL